MSREIKFRAWDKMEDKMFKHEIAKAWPISITEWHNYEFMQFIGIYETIEPKREIYEGDVIEFDNTVIGGKKFIGEVAWNNDQTLDGLCYGIWVKNGGWLKTDFLGEIKIIGNIYENPSIMSYVKNSQT